MQVELIPGYFFCEHNLFLYKCFICVIIGIVFALLFLFQVHNPIIKTYSLFCFVRLGVSHDSSGSCPNNQYVMATAVPGGSLAFKWSSCSREKFQTLLR